MLVSDDVLQASDLLERLPFLLASARASLEAEGVSLAALTRSYLDVANLGNTLAAGTRLHARLEDMFRAASVACGDRSPQAQGTLRALASVHTNLTAVIWLAEELLALPARARDVERATRLQRPGSSLQVLSDFCCRLEAIAARQGRTPAGTMELECLPRLDQLAECCWSSWISSLHRRLDRATSVMDRSSVVGLARLAGVLDRIQASKQPGLPQTLWGATALLAAYRRIDHAADCLPDRPALRLVVLWLERRLGALVRESLEELLLLPSDSERQADGGDTQPVASTPPSGSPRHVAGSGPCWPWWTRGLSSFRPAYQPGCSSVPGWRRQWRPRWSSGSTGCPAGTSRS